MIPNKRAVNLLGVVGCNKASDHDIESECDPHMIAKNTKPTADFVGVFILSSILPCLQSSLCEVRLAEIFTPRRPWRNLIAMDHVASNGIFAMYPDFL